MAYTDALGERIDICSDEGLALASVDYEGVSAGAMLTLLLRTSRSELNPSIRNTTAVNVRGNGAITTSRHSAWSGTLDEPRPASDSKGSTPKSTAAKVQACTRTANICDCIPGHPNCICLARNCISAFRCTQQRKNNPSSYSIVRDIASSSNARSAHPIV